MKGTDLNPKPQGPKPPLFTTLVDSNDPFLKKNLHNPSTGSCLGKSRILLTDVLPWPTSVHVKTKILSEIYGCQNKI